MSRQSASYPNRYRTPGVYRVDDYPRPEPRPLPTGVPVFLGVFRLREPYQEQQKQSRQVATRLTRWLQFVDQVEPGSLDANLSYAVRGFFENDGQLCYLLPLDEWKDDALETALEHMAHLDNVDLICVPDLVAQSDPIPIQAAILDHCERGNTCFAILDSLPGQDLAAVLDQRAQLSSPNGALYYPWVDVGARDERGAPVFKPSCGHIAGVYARSDRRVGVHKAPANEVLNGVVGLAQDLNDLDQGQLNPEHVNCLRSFRGRGIRIWGARTLSRDSAWMYVNVRRQFIAVIRWIEHALADTVFEPNDSRHWARIKHRLDGYFSDLVRAGALQAYIVRCDAQTNADQSRDAGQVIIEIDLAFTVPAEFIQVRIIHGPSGVTIAEPGKVIGQA